MKKLTLKIELLNSQQAGIKFALFIHEILSKPKYFNNKWAIKISIYVTTSLFQKLKLKRSLNVNKILSLMSKLLTTVSLLSVHLI